MKKTSSQFLELKLFAGMSRELAQDIVRRIGGEDIHHFKKGAIIVYEGTKAKWLVPVLSGTVSVHESGANGERHLVRSVRAGGLFGATLVTTRMEYYPGMAVAASDCAHYLGVTRVSLSRAISHLVKRGEIAHPGKGRFVLLRQGAA